MNSNVGSLRSSGGVVRGAPPRAAAPVDDKPLAPGADLVVLARIVDEASKKPISGASFEVRDAAGKALVAGTTDWQGVVRHAVAQAGTYTVAVTAPPEGATRPVPASAAGGDPVEIAVRQKGAFVLSVVVTAIGGVPLAEHDVRIVDPSTRKAVGDPVRTDALGWLTAMVPENKPYDLEVVDAPDEEASDAGDDDEDFDGQEECEVTSEEEAR